MIRLSRKILRSITASLFFSFSYHASGFTDKLIPPQLTPDYIKSYITCIRPTREPMFRIASEIIHQKLVIHDYGHGGAGWTLLFGSVQKSIGLFKDAVKNHPEFTGKPIRVIGGGAHGLLTAIRLKQEGFNVTVIAENYEELTSHKGAGIFAPGPMNLSPDEQKEVGDVLIDSYESWKNIALGTDPQFTRGAL